MLSQRIAISLASGSKVFQLGSQLNADLQHAFGHCDDKLDEVEIIQLLGVSSATQIHRCFT